jgi:hypothetical protein
MRKQWKQVEQGLQRFAFVWQESPAALYEVLQKKCLCFSPKHKRPEGQLLVITE